MAKFIQKQIQIHVVNPDDGLPLSYLMMVSGNFAYRKTEHKDYNVTHIPSGFLLALRIFRAKMAREIVDIANQIEHKHGLIGYRFEGDRVFITNEPSSPTYRGMAALVRKDVDSALQILWEVKGIRENSVFKPKEAVPTLVPLTLDEAKQLKSGDILYSTFQKNSKGEPAKWKVNGMVQTWKRSPDRVKVPIKHGLYAYDYVTEHSLYAVSLGRGE